MQPVRGTPPVTRPSSRPLAAISKGRVASSRGGVLIRDKEGKLLGSIGVSGDRPENDEACAVAGVESVSLIADAG